MLKCESRVQGQGSIYLLIFGPGGCKYKGKVVSRAPYLKWKISEYSSLKYSDELTFLGFRLNVKWSPIGVLFLYIYTVKNALSDDFRNKLDGHAWIMEIDSTS